MFCLGCTRFYELLLFVAAWRIGYFDELCHNGFRTSGEVFFGFGLQFPGMSSSLIRLVGRWSLNPVLSNATVDITSSNIAARLSVS